LETYVRRDGEYPQDAWEVMSRTDGEVQMAPCGGGFVVRIPAESLEVQFRPYDPATDLAPFQAVRVTGDWLPEGETLPAYTRGERWNGWATPVFEKAAADRLAELGLVTRAAGLDAYIESADEGGPAQLFSAEQITVEGKDLTVYSIGTGFWCWEVSV